MDRRYFWGECVYCEEEKAVTVEKGNTVCRDCLIKPKKKPKARNMDEDIHSAISER